MRTRTSDLTDQSRHTSAFSGDVGVDRATRDRRRAHRERRPRLARTDAVRTVRERPATRRSALRDRRPDARPGDEPQPRRQHSLEQSSRARRGRRVSTIGSTTSSTSRQPARQQGNLQVYRYQHALATLDGAEVSADVDPARMLTLRGAIRHRARDERGHRRAAPAHPAAANDTRGGAPRR